jgi:hypothetical protein
MFFGNNRAGQTRFTATGFDNKESFNLAIFLNHKVRNQGSAHFRQLFRQQIPFIPNSSPDTAASESKGRITITTWPIEGIGLGSLNGGLPGLIFDLELA